MAEKHRVLVIGTGSIGERHTRCFLETQRADVSICEINKALCDDVAGRYALSGAFTDLDEAIKHSYDAAIVCVPANLHIAVATKLASNGIHLLIEKPLATNLDGIEELEGVIAERSLTVGVAYVLRTNPALRSMKEAIDSGRFGKPVQFTTQSGQHFPTYRPAYREIYYTRHETGGGAIQDAITHIANASEWLVGSVRKIVADAEHKILDGVDVEDTVHFITRHENDVMGSFSLNQHQAPNEGYLQIACERGTVRFEFHNGRWFWMTEPGAEWNEGDHQALERDEIFVLQANHYLDAIEGKVPVNCTLEAGKQTLCVNLAALESVRSGRWVSVG